MPNLNLPTNRGQLKMPFRPGVFQAPNSGPSLTVASPAMVDALLKLGWTRTGD